MRKILHLIEQGITLCASIPATRRGLVSKTRILEVLKEAYDMLDKAIKEGKL